MDDDAKAESAKKSKATKKKNLKDKEAAQQELADVKAELKAEKAKGSAYKRGMKDALAYHKESSK